MLSLLMLCVARGLRAVFPGAARKRRVRRKRGNHNLSTKPLSEPKPLSLCLPRSGIRSVRFVGQHRALFDYAGFGEIDVDTRLLDQKHDREAWFAARDALVATASDFRAACFDDDPFKSRESLLLKKKALKRSSTSTADYVPAQKWGLSQERGAIEQYARDTKNKVYATGLYTDSTFRFGASPDGLVFDKKTNETGLLEVKCLWSRRFKRKMPNWSFCPARFQAQIQGQLLVCDDAHFCDLVAWIPRNSNGPNYTVVRITRDQAFQKRLQHHLDAFATDLDNLNYLGEKQVDSSSRSLAL